MMKFVKNYLETMEGIEVFPIISLVLFFGFFVLLCWWVLAAKKEYIDEVSHLPFERNDRWFFLERNLTNALINRRRWTRLMFWVIQSLLLLIVIKEGYIKRLDWPIKIKTLKISLFPWKI